MKKLFAKKDKKETGEAGEEKLQLQKFSKQELLQIMLAQGEEIDELRARISELEAELEKHEFEMSQIGSIAEASLQATDYFKDADKAVRIYLENVRRRYE